MLSTGPISSVLRCFHLFRNLSEHELKAVAATCKSGEFARGDYLFYQSEEILQVYFVISGRVRLFSTSEDGKEQTFLLADQGDMFPHLGFFRTDSYPHHAVALDDVHCLVIPVRTFEQLLLAHPAISFKIMQVLADKIIDLQQRLEDKTFYPVESQLVSLLLRLSETHAARLDAEWLRFSTTFTNSELAGMLGTTRETVNRTIQKLKKQQAVVMAQGGSMHIHLEKLRSLLPDTPVVPIDPQKDHFIRTHAQACCVRGCHEV
ncbi:MULTISPECIES: Crp/Fnr family transcriptional regulator [Brevibacillus]|uniref:Crp/Fnr family transcriptional regulator n=1 Tax=Brevibacillus TaxID=55080 RepID=UPI00156BA47C|nr:MULTISPECIES: Crp/Fnr family transcriptional regulator [Brevibacillus]UED70423.1 Crp/Fnr family transcriptional regulator [Brevibacillus sp. HD3.3A]WDV96713.1 Crp/Fnr family transcriptional regulator [Brevibacillus parabrevis]